MLIQPDSYIRLIKNCPIDNSYRDTIYFESREEQTNYFKNTLQGIPFTKQSYQRYDKGVLHIQEKADNLYACNYLMFQNTAFGNKWFYAFINSIEYVNNISSKIYYEIDVLQTWLLDLTIHPCFVERQHTATDNVGDNLIPETIDVGEYVADSQILWGGSLSDMSVVFEYQGTWEWVDEALGTYTTLGSGIYSKVYSNTNYTYVPLVDTSAVEIVTKLIRNTNILTFGGLRSIFMMPTKAMLHFDGSDDVATGLIDTIKVVRPSVFMDGHKVKNNKLFTYPYCCVNVCGDTDSGKDFAFESFYFTDEEPGTAAFFISCPLALNASVVAYPAKYQKKLFPSEYAVQTAPYPLCKYVEDKVVEWYANNVLTTLGSSIAALTGLFAGGSGITASSAKRIFSEHPVLDESIQNNTSIPANIRESSQINQAVREGVLNNLRQQKVGNNNCIIGNSINNALSAIQHTNTSSNGGGSSIFSTPRGGGITVTVKTLKHYAAKIIDDYFTMYGYSIKSINQPEFDVRESYTYIKTSGFSAHGGVPSSTISKISAIHDSGITYWKPNKTVGDYSQSNRPISEVQNDG